jgi:hypothetical protein
MQAGNIESVGVIGAGRIGQAMAKIARRVRRPVVIANSLGSGSLTSVVEGLGDGVTAGTVKDPDGRSLSGAQFAALTDVKAARDRGRRARLWARPRLRDTLPRESQPAAMCMPPAAPIATAPLPAGVGAGTQRG